MRTFGFALKRGTLAAKAAGVSAYVGLGARLGTTFAPLWGHMPPSAARTGCAHRVLPARMRLSHSLALWDVSNLGETGSASAVHVATRET